MTQRQTGGGKTICLTAIAVVQRILKKLGQKLEFKHQVRLDGKPTRVDQGCNLDLDGRQAVFENWLEQNLLQDNVTSFSKEEYINTEGVTAA